MLWGLRGDPITADRPIWGPPFDYIIENLFVYSKIQRKFTEKKVEMISIRFFLGRG